MIPKLPFGRTGFVSTRTLFGAAALGAVTQAEADATMDLLQSFGVNHVDTAASYGEAEVRLGDWIRRHGKPFFLATKTGERTAAAARDEFHRSLERLHVDKLDLLQLHNLVDPQEWEVALGPGGALEAVVEARSQGLVDYIGVTGHGLTVATMHRRALERFDFDSVLLPYNYVLMQNAQYLGEYDALVALCQERDVAVQTIKGIARGPWGDRTHTRTTWYEPLEDQADIDRAVQWVLARPGLFLNTAGDIHLLPRILEAASHFQNAPTNRELQAALGGIAMTPLFTA
jgi:aryl-alcohol dehydrogenase-like predicted oxidoreductase